MEPTPLPATGQERFDSLADSLTAAMLSVSVALKRSNEGRGVDNELEMSLQAVSRAAEDMLQLYKMWPHIPPDTTGSE